MRLDLSAEHLPEDGSLVGPDGHRNWQRTTRSKRKEADRLVAEGVPFVLDYWAGDQLEWFDGEDARVEWQRVRRHFIAEDPHGKGDVEWTGGRWEDGD